MYRPQAFFRNRQARFLIVSACTAKKMFRPPDQLTEADLDDPFRRQAGAARLHQCLLPAAEMYTGAGHNLVRHAVRGLREHDYHVSHFIVSAGYGLLNETDVVAPYNVTFSGKPIAWIQNRGQRLQLRESLVRIASEYDRLILVLGRDYLEAIGMPLPVAELPPALVYLAPSIATRIGAGIEIILVGEAERRKIGAYSSSAKEKQFHLDVYDELHAGESHE